jgi:hypothetical protein
MAFDRKKKVIPFLNQSAIFVSNAARQGTPANVWACLGRRRLPQSAAADLLSPPPCRLDIIFE